MIDLLVRRIREAVEVEEFRWASERRDEKPYAPEEGVSQNVKFLTHSFIDTLSSSKSFIVPRVVKVKGGGTAPLVAIPTLYTSNMGIKARVSEAEGAGHESTAYDHQKLSSLQEEFYNNLTKFADIDDTEQFFKEILATGDNTYYASQIIQRRIKYFFSSTTFLLIIDLIHPTSDNINFVLRLNERGEFVFVYRYPVSPQGVEELERGDVEVFLFGSPFGGGGVDGGRIGNHWGKFFGNYFIAHDFARIRLKALAGKPPAQQKAKPTPQTPKAQQQTHSSLVNIGSMFDDEDTGEQQQQQTETGVSDVGFGGGFVSLFQILANAKLYYPKEPIPYNTITVNSSHLTPSKRFPSLLKVLNFYGSIKASEGLCATPFTESEVSSFSTTSSASSSLRNFCDKLFHGDFDESYYRDTESTSLTVSYEYKKLIGARGIMGIAIARKWLSSADLDSDDKYKRIIEELDDFERIRRSKEFIEFAESLKERTGLDIIQTNLPHALRMPFYFLRLVGVRGGKFGIIDQYGLGDPTRHDLGINTDPTTARLYSKDKEIREIIKDNLFTFYELFITKFVKVLDFKSDLGYGFKYFEFLSDLVNGRGEFAIIPEEEVRRSIGRALMFIDESGRNVPDEEIVEYIEKDLVGYLSNFNKGILKTYDPYNATGAYEGLWYTVVTFYENFIAGEQPWFDAQDFASIVAEFRDKYNNLKFMSRDEWHDILVKVAVRGIFMFEFNNTFSFEVFRREGDRVVFPRYKKISEILEEFKIAAQNAIKSRDFKDPFSEDAAFIDVMFGYGVHPDTISKASMVVTKDVEIKKDEILKMLYEDRSSFVKASQIGEDHKASVYIF